MKQTHIIDKNMTPGQMAYEQTEMSSERTAMASERTAMASERTALAQERTAMAVEQTEMAYERTQLTNTQTLLSYTRTSIGLLAAGIGMFEFVNNQAIITLGMIIMLLAPVVEAIGVIHFFLTRRRLKEVLDPAAQKLAIASAEQKPDPASQDPADLH